jgi:hypothetical protein
MRLWSLHPKYLDTKGLLALWREGLLAYHVLLGKTKGYKNHPQLIRFKQHKNPAQAVCNYLHCVQQEATNRNYKFDVNKLQPIDKNIELISVTTGQMEFELKHLLNKLEKRDITKFNEFKQPPTIDPHTMFIVIDGTIEDWERI